MIMVRYSENTLTDQTELHSIESFEKYILKQFSQKRCFSRSVDIITLSTTDAGFIPNLLIEVVWNFNIAIISSLFSVFW